MTAWLIVAAAASLLLVYCAVGLALADVLTRSRRRRVQGTPADLGLHYEEVQFRAQDGVVLRGWFITSPGARATIVFVHDGDGTRSQAGSDLLPLQRDYVRRGYHVFAFDMRGRGESGGRRDHLGSLERFDLLAAIAYARGRSDTRPLLLHGFGLGAALAIQSVAEGEGVQAIIADSAFAGARTQLRRRHRHIPRPLFALACWCARRVHHADVDRLAPIRVIDRVQPPIFFVHGDADATVPVADSLNLSAASLNRANALWVVPNVGHCTAYAADPRAYLRRCLDFIETVVPARLRPLPAAVERASGE